MGGDLMQIIFETKDKPETYADRGTGRYPEAPEHCPHAGCNKPVKMKKHGFYKRYIILRGLNVQIRIRRYKCPVCGKTVSMLPAFCLSYYQYGIEAITAMLKSAVECGVHAATRTWGAEFAQVTRRHIAFWRAQLKRNTKLIVYGLIQISPGFMERHPKPGEYPWTRCFLDEIDASPQKFNAEFHKTTAKTFLSS
jgi:transposase-like protein